MELLTPETPCLVVSVCPPPSKVMMKVFYFWQKIFRSGPAGRQPKHGEACLPVVGG